MSRYLRYLRIAFSATCLVACVLLIVLWVRSYKYADLARNAPLGTSRLENLTIHHGRHTFISHALAGGRTLAEVRDAVGHANVSITSGYLHVAVDNDSVGRLFG